MTYYNNEELCEIAQDIRWNKGLGQKINLALYNQTIYYNENKTVFNQTVSCVTFSNVRQTLVGRIESGTYLENENRMAKYKDVIYNEQSEIWETLNT